MVEHEYKDVAVFFETFRMYPLLDFLQTRENLIKTDAWRGDPSLWKAKDEFLKQLEVVIHSLIKEMGR